MPGSVRKIIAGRWDSPFTRSAEALRRSDAGRRRDPARPHRIRSDGQEAARSRRRRLSLQQALLRQGRHGGALQGAAQRQAADRQPPGAGRHRRPAGQLPRPRALLGDRAHRHEAGGLLARRLHRRLLPAAEVRAGAELARRAATPRSMPSASSISAAARRSSGSPTSCWSSTRGCRWSAAPSRRAFDLPISQEVMSDTLGLSVPHLNRMLAKLRTDGMLTSSPIAACSSPTSGRSRCSRISSRRRLRASPRRSNVNRNLIA